MKTQCRYWKVSFTHRFHCIGIAQRETDLRLRTPERYLRSALSEEFPPRTYLLPEGPSGRTGYHQLYLRHYRIFQRSHAPPYRSIWSNVAYCFEMLPVKAGDHIVSMLPMGHVFGMVYDFLYGFSAGAHIYFLTRMPSPKIIAQPFAEIKPRVISCVPLIVEKIIKKDILPRVDSKIGKLLLKVPIVNDKIKSLARQAAMEIFGGNFDEIIIGGARFQCRSRSVPSKR